MVPSTWVCVASCERGVAVRAVSSRASVNGFAWFSRPQKAAGMLIAPSSRLGITHRSAAESLVTSATQVEANAEIFRDVSRCVAVRVALAGCVGHVVRRAV